MVSHSSDVASLQVLSLRSQVPEGVLMIGRDQPRLTWRFAATDVVQTGYEIEAAPTAGFDDILATTGMAAGDAQLGVPAPGGPLASREVRYYRVRVFAGETASEWSPVLRLEAGLLEPADWSPARAITLPDDRGRDRQAPAPVLRREFGLDHAPVRT